MSWRMRIQAEQVKANERNPDLQVSYSLRLRPLERSDRTRQRRTSDDRQASNRASLAISVDKFHLIAALPYVDEIVTGDKLFRKIHPVAVKTGHVRALLIGNDDFLNRF